MPDRVQRKPCQRCGAMVLWAHTKKLTPIPLDAQPVTGPQGLYFITQAGAALHVDTFSTPEEREGKKFYRPHRLSCTHAALWPAEDGAAAIAGEAGEEG